MERTLTMGLCLTTALLLNGVAVATPAAFAEAPEFVFSSGSAAVGSIGGSWELETTSGEEVKCTSQSGDGEVEGSSGTKKVTALFIIFKGCTSTILAKTYKCKSAGAAEEEIQTNELSGRLGWVKKSESKIGILLSPSGSLFAEFECVRSTEKVKIKVKGSAIASITPVETLVGPSESTTFFTVTLEKGEGKGKSLDTKFEGEPENVLETESTTSKKFIGSAIEASSELCPARNTKIAG